VRWARWWPVRAFAAAVITRRGTLAASAMPLSPPRSRSRPATATGWADRADAKGATPERQRLHQDDLIAHLRASWLEVGLD